MMGIALQNWWRRRLKREQLLLKLAAAAILATIVWSIAVARPLKILKAHDAAFRQTALNLQSVLSMQAQAKTLNQLPAISAAGANVALRASLQKHFGSKADINFAGSSATVTVKDTSPESIALWLATARTEAGASATQATLGKSGNVWSGTFQMTLPTD